MQVHLYNTLSRTVEALERPAPGEHFRLYVCGPTVYGPAHIGNLLTFTRFDLLYRLLKALDYRPYFVRNITDVDDKTIAGAREAGQPLEVFTRHWTEVFHKDTAALGLKTPDVEPRATEHIPQQLEMIERLMELGNAYRAADGSVYFRIASFPRYGQLSGFDLKALSTQSSNSAGGANLADEYDREAVADFALWKAHKPEDGAVFWESPWGRGRPGWHLECSAMSRHYLGDCFDLHGGGEDLCFPHHENEMAQSESVTGCAPMAKYWMHARHLLVEGKKMAKSAGNFYTLGQLLDQDEVAVEAADIRWAFLAGHYRQQLNFTFPSLRAAQSARRKLGQLLVKLAQAAGAGEAERTAWTREPYDAATAAPWSKLWEALCDDLNTPRALGACFTAFQQLGERPLDPQTAERHLRGLAPLLAVLGLETQPWAPEPEAGAQDVPEAIAQLAQERWSAKQARDFARADALRGELSAQGWQVLDGKDGYTLSRA